MGLFRNWSTMLSFGLPFTALSSVTKLIRLVSSPLHSLKVPAFDVLIRQKRSLVFRSDKKSKFLNLYESFYSWLVIVVVMNLIWWSQIWWMESVFDFTEIRNSSRGWDDARPHCIATDSIPWKLLEPSLWSCSHLQRVGWSDQLGWQIHTRQSLQVGLAFTFQSSCLCTKPCPFFYLIGWFLFLML